MNVLYTAEATTTAGRDGRATSSDGILDVKLATPKALGGAGGEATNPEQLFAAGYSACFLSAAKLVASQDKIALSPEAQVTAKVGIGPVEVGFNLDIELHVNFPDMSKEEALALAEKAHVVCPYSNATRGNVDVRLFVL